MNVVEEPNDFTIAELKEKLKALVSLSLKGNKIELIS